MASPLTIALTDLRDALASVRLPLPLPRAAELTGLSRDFSKQLDDYVLPRLQRIEAPLLAVVGGSTGAGKSTLVNSLIGRVVTKPGVIRPTTRSPVLVYHPDDARWFADERILPGLIRSNASSDDTRSLHLVPEPTLPRGLAVLDAPDIDSVVVENRRLAAQLLSAADLWLFVTSAARYADAVPWDYLASAVDRSAAVAVVVDRVPPAAMAEVPPHLGQMMTERGLASSPLFAVPETTTDADGLLPDAAVASIRGWLAALAADQNTRAWVVMQTLDGAIGSLTRQAPDIAQAVDDQLDHPFRRGDRDGGHGTSTPKFAIADSTALAAVWPSPQIEASRITWARSASTSSSLPFALPEASRCRASSWRTVPTRQGTHWPHDSSRKNSAMRRTASTRSADSS